MFQQVLKLFKSPKSTKVDIGKNTYTCPSGHDGYKGGINTGPVPERPSKPELSEAYLEKLDKENMPSSSTISHEEKTSSPTDSEIPLPPELVKRINEIIEENYEYVWRWDASREIEDLYEDFRYFHNRYWHHSLKSLTKEKLKLLDDIYYAMQALKDKHISYKEYKSLKNLLNELYKSSALRYYTPDINEYSIRPFTPQDKVESIEKALETQWGKKR